jgi:hypothetical protein
MYAYSHHPTFNIQKETFAVFVQTKLVQELSRGAKIEGIKMTPMGKSEINTLPIESCL